MECASERGNTECVGMGMTSLGKCRCRNGATCAASGNGMARCQTRLEQVNSAGALFEQPDDASEVLKDAEDGAAASGQAAVAVPALIGILACSLVAFVATASLRLLRTGGSRSVTAYADQDESNDGETFLE